MPFLFFRYRSRLLDEVLGQVREQADTIRVLREEVDRLKATVQTLSESPHPSPDDPVSFSRGVLDEAFYFDDELAAAEGRSRMSGLRGGTSLP